MGVNGCMTCVFTPYRTKSTSSEVLFTLLFVQFRRWRPKEQILETNTAFHFQLDNILLRIGFRNPNNLPKELLYAALKYAMKTDMVPQNVAMKVDRPRKNSFQPTFLDAEQMQKLFEIVKGTRLELPVLVAAFYGLRRGEVLGLKWDAIDFNRGTLTIKRTVTEATIDGTMKIIEQDSAKTKSSLRTLPLVGSFRDYFQKVKEAQELNKKVCGNCYNYDYDGYVFVNELGERMRPNYLTEYFPKYIAKHGMPKMRFHDLRHSCASLLLANGVPLKQIQEWLGHSDFSTTANIYAHLDYRSKISSAQAMEQGMLLPRSDDFGSRWENVTEQGKITEPDLNPGF